jgi:general secretion pathway protein L
MARGVFSAGPNWPARGLIVRAPARADETGARRFAWLQYEGGRVIGEGHAALEALPAAAAVVLLLAASDVVLTRARVPPLSSARLREALPNLVEDMTLSDPSTLHVALGQTRDAAGRVTLALVERAWLRALLERFAAAGRRVAAVLPESLCVPLEAQGWTLVRQQEPGVAPRCWLRLGQEEALALPVEATAARAMLDLLLARQPAGQSPPRIDAWLEGWSDGDSLDTTGLNLQMQQGSPLRAWLARVAGGRRDSVPLSLLQHEFASGGGAGWAKRWRRVALLLLLLAGVQLAGMQWQWQQLRSERSTIQADMSARLRALFPETSVILDAPLQMAQSVARLRAAAGRSDPGDFTVMTAVAAQLFATLPPNAARALSYTERSLRVRLAPQALVDGAARAALVTAAAQAGYELRFEEIPAGAAPAEAQAVLRVKAAS